MTSSRCNFPEHPSRPFLDQGLCERSGVLVGRVAEWALRCCTQRVYLEEISRRSYFLLFFCLHFWPVLVIGASHYMLCVVYRTNARWFVGLLLVKWAFAFLRMLCSQLSLSVPTNIPFPSLNLNLNVAGWSLIARVANRKVMDSASTRTPRQQPVQCVILAVKSSTDAPFESTVRPARKTAKS